MKQRKLLYLLAILSFLAGFIGSVAVYRFADLASRSDLIDRATLVASGISTDDLSVLSGTEADLANSAYERVKTYLTRAQSIEGDIRFAYALGEAENGDIFFFADSENPSSPDYSPPGQVYYEVSDATKEIFVDGVARTDGPSRDRWGVWISAYAPLIAVDGSVVAVIGIDTPAYRYLAEVGFLSASPIIFGILLALICIVLANIKQRPTLDTQQPAA